MLFALLALSSLAASRPFSDDDIVGGTQVSSVNKYPWMASINIGGSHSCGGSLIADNLLLTAAHCSSGSASQRKVSVWRYDITKTPKQENAVEFDVVAMNTHPKYKTNSYGAPIFDVSVWLLKQTSNPLNRTLVTVNYRKTSYVAQSNDFIHAIGWGALSQSGGAAKFLMEVDVPVVPIDVCQKQYKNFPDSLSEGNVCAAEPNGGKDTCQGDSGGPVFLNVEPPVVLGITSWGQGCAQKGYPGVYANVGYFNDFVQSIVGKYQ